MPIYRGIYPIFHQDFVDDIKGHCDTHFFQVGSVIYLNDVKKDGGEFMVWPGSHHIIYPHANTLSHTSRPDGFDKLLDKVQNTIDPIHITGKKGTVILWHHRLLHSAGNNNLGGIRYAMLCDFKNGIGEEKSRDFKKVAFDETWSNDVQIEYHKFCSERSSFLEKLQHHSIDEIELSI